ncbi:hypothetical protein ASAP_2285 [Asaia bogorensis]|uniref:Uncharacterized protein n=1 Tax=Asaia bogorensis TaxID=91915 RepID=A0A060QHB6_9PROT|nr:hypothetical protein ASAP_2285 [Asaia bogorensis]
MSIFRAGGRLQYHYVTLRLATAPRSTGTWRCEEHLKNRNILQGLV